MTLEYRYDANGRQVGVTTEAGRAAVAEAATTLWCTCPEPDPVPYESDGALGHGWDCGGCGKLLQVG